MSEIPSVLVACECSQVVMSAFLRYGCDAYSCDLEPSYGDYPDRHYQCDAIDALYDRAWDLVIAHPPCTFLSLAGAVWYADPMLFPDRYLKLLDARRFFYEFVQYGVAGHRIAIENPRPLKLASLPRNSDVVDPYLFGDQYSKRTYLWLYRLPPLFPVYSYQVGTGLTSVFSSQKMRSQFQPCLAEAMAAQWVPIIRSDKYEH